MTTNLFTYDHPYSGSTTVLVEVPDIPVRINVFDFPGARVGAVLASPVERNLVQIGQGDPHGTGVKIRSVNSATLSTRSITGVLRNSFSFSSSSGGSVMQCDGSISMGLNKKAGLDLIVPRRSFLNMRGHGSVVVTKGSVDMSLEQAVGDGLLDVKFQNEL